MSFVHRPEGSPAGVQQWLSGGRPSQADERTNTSPGVGRFLVCLKNSSKMSGLEWSERGTAEGDRDGEITSPDLYGTCGTLNLNQNEQLRGQTDE